MKEEAFTLGQPCIFVLLDGLAATNKVKCITSPRMGVCRVLHVKVSVLLMVFEHLAVHHILEVIRVRLKPVVAAEDKKSGHLLEHHQGGIASRCLFVIGMRTKKNTWHHSGPACPRGMIQNPHARGQGVHAPTLVECPLIRCSILAQSICDCQRKTVKHLRPRTGDFSTRYISRCCGMTTYTLFALKISLPPRKSFLPKQMK